MGAAQDGVAPQLDRGLNQLVELTGASKASLVRRAIAELLESAGLASTGAVEFTLARGPGVGRQKKGRKR